MSLKISFDKKIEENEVISLYKANKWSSADKPKELLLALKNSHSLLTVRFDGRLIAMGNAISDGHLVVYYSHMLVHPEFQGQGIGRKMMEAFQSIYKNFHQQLLIADVEAVDFYKSLGFVRAGKTESMWIYDGND